jgi:RimJ/RimL family protein N-acetyltransferase
MNDKKYEIELRPTTVADLDILFQFQLDHEGRHLAAFMSQDSTHKEAYLAKYTRLLNDPTVNNQTIIADSEIVGSIAKFVMEGDAELTYWIDRQFWGKGVATNALKNFLNLETARPLFWKGCF